MPSLRVWDICSNSKRHSKFFVACVMLLMSGCAIQQRQEQLDAKLENQSGTVASINDRLTLLEKKNDVREEKLADIQKGVQQERADMQVSLDDLRTELQRLRGTQEELSHKTALLKVEMQKIRLELQKSDTKESKPLTEIESYNQANKALLEEKNYEAAIAQFQAFVQQYPQSNLTDNAIYWIGEALYRQKKYKEAIAEFQNVIEKHPKSDKKCSALLGQGLAFEQLAERDNARLFYEEVIEQCKNSKEASLASEGFIRSKPTGTTKPKKSKRK